MHISDLESGVDHVIRVILFIWKIILQNILHNIEEKEKKTETNDEKEEHKGEQLDLEEEYELEEDSTAVDYEPEELHDSEVLMEEEIEV